MSVEIEAAKLMEFFKWKLSSEPNRMGNPDMIDNVADKIVDVPNNCFSIANKLELNTCYIAINKTAIK